MKKTQHGLLSFKGTIDGANYFWRQTGAVLVYALAMVIAFYIYKEVEVIGGLVMFLAFGGYITFALTNLNKRLNALMPNNKVLGWVLCFVPYISSIVVLYLIFANSNIKKQDHNG